MDRKLGSLFSAPPISWLHPGAMVLFNASSGVPTILVSRDVTSITDNAAGDFTVNYREFITTPCVLATSRYDGAATGSYVKFATTNPTTTAARLTSHEGSGDGVIDAARMSVSVFGYRT